MNHNRRQVISAMATAAFSPAICKLIRAAESLGEDAPHIATNMYPWLTFARRANQNFIPHSDGLLSAIASTGVNGYEPIIEGVADFDGLGERLDKYSLEMRSIYVNSTLHNERAVEKSIADVLAIADQAVKVGVKVIVTNPSPIRWGGTEDKNDSELRLQAKSLDHLGQELRNRGVTLAYHNHDAELRQGAREFHHMLTATDPSNVKFCLDAHWVFRGCGDSEVAVFDTLARYQDRVVELHLRQSTAGVWTESFNMRGDIDYTRMFLILKSIGVRPHLVLEQAVEADSTNKMTVVEAHRRGRENLSRATV